MTDITDEALMAALAGDDKGAFRALSERYLQRVWRISFRVLQDRQDAEEVMQDVFVTVWNNRHNWQEGEAKFSTWIYRVTMNRSIDLKRKRKTVHDELHEDITDDSSPNAEAIAESHEMRYLLMECLKELPENQMLAMLYYYFEEMEIDGIQRKLSITEDAARSLLKRARANMKEIIGSRIGTDAFALQALAPYLKR